MRKLPNVLVLLLALFIVATPHPVFACAQCRYSPDKFGFCRWNFDRGYAQCDEVVVDQFSGKTDCKLLDSSCGTPDPPNGGGTGWDDCFWDDCEQYMF